MSRCSQEVYEFVAGCIQLPWAEGWTSSVQTLRGVTLEAAVGWLHGDGQQGSHTALGRGVPLGKSGCGRK